MTISADLLIVNGKIYFRGQLLEGCIAIREGKICYVGKETAAPRASEKLDLAGKVTLPGLIDIHTHLRDLQLAYKEDFYTGSRSALVGGFSTVFDMPTPVKPSESLSQLHKKMTAAKARTVGNVGFYSAFSETPEDLTKIVQLGAIGFKIYMNRRENLDGGDDREIEKALARAHSVGLPVAIHAEDFRTIEKLEARFMASGDSSPQAFLRAHPPKTETLAVERVIKMAQRIGTQIHFCHMSTAKSLRQIKAAKALGLPITCEVTPHHLLLSSKAVSTLRGRAVMVPPLRSESNLRAMWQGLVDSTVDLVASDHAPHNLAEKDSEDIWKVPPGIPGLETTLPLLLTAVNQSRLTLKRLVEVLAERPAKVLGLADKGFIETGFDGDLVVVDLKRGFLVDVEKFQSKAKYSPFDGWKLKGRPEKTFVRGRLVVDDGNVLAKPGEGTIVRRT